MEGTTSPSYHSSPNPYPNLATIANKLVSNVEELGSSVKGKGRC